MGYKEAIELHLDGMEYERYPIHEHTAKSTYLEIAHCLMIDI